MRFTRSFSALGCILVSGILAAQSRPPMAAVGEDGGRSLQTLVDSLSHDQFKTREDATREIWELGEPALPALREAVHSKDPEQAIRARELLRKIELHITPSTDPAVIALVERYAKANSSEKEALLQALRERRAWRQMLKLFAAEKKPELRAALQNALEGVAVVAARERLIEGDAAGAKDFLEMAPVTPDSLVALAAFHRSQGTLEQELERASTLKGVNSDAWKLALYRAAGNSAAAREAAEASGNQRIAAAMAVLDGDPLPWLRQNGAGMRTAGAHELYPALAIRRWQGRKIKDSDLDPFRRLLDGDNEERWVGAASLILLGKTTDAEKRHASDVPLQAFYHFDSMERIPEALQTLGLDPEMPDYRAWVAERVERLWEDPDDEGNGSEGIAELLYLADFMQRRGLQEEAYAAFGPPLAELAKNNRDEFSDFFGGLFRRINPNRPPMSALALRIGSEWAGEEEDRWDDLLNEAFHDEEMIDEWWNWLRELEPDRTSRDRFAGLLALFDYGVDPQNLRKQWMDRVWEAVEATPADERAPQLGRILFLTSHAPDAASSLRAADLSGNNQEEMLTIAHSFILTANGRWDDAAGFFIRLLGRSANIQAANPQFHAFAAAYLRQAGRIEEAASHDDWVEKLALGDPMTSLQIAVCYSSGHDYERAALWHSRAAHECDPDSATFSAAIKAHADSLLEKRDWAAAASTAEALALMAASAENINAGPMELMRIRFYADLPRAMATLGTDREAAIARLAECHRTFARDGTLADHFFPMLREAGLVKEHDEWFEISWKLVNETIARFPGSDNTMNTAGWLASRAVRRLDEALELQREALRINPNQAAYLDTMAEIEFAHGNRDEAIRWSELSVNFGPTDLMIRQQYHRFLRAPLPR